MKRPSGEAGTDRGDWRAGHRRGLGQRPPLSADPVPQRADRPRPTGCVRWRLRAATSRWCASCTRRGAATLEQAVDMYCKLLDRHRKLVEDRRDDMLKAQRHAVDRIVHRYPPARRGVLLDPDVGDAELRVPRGSRSWDGCPSTGSAGGSGPTDIGLPWSIRRANPRATAASTEPYRWRRPCAMGSRAGEPVADPCTRATRRTPRSRGRPPRRSSPSRRPP